MTKNLTIADVQFFLDNINIGDTPLPGADPFLPDGIRTIDGSNNNIFGGNVIDQWGNFVSTDTFGLTGEGFINISSQTSALAYEPLSNVPGTMIFDATPRIVSNLIADATSSNPASLGFDLLTQGDAAVDRLPENSLFTFFGQFFDHGLDFITKGSGETVLIPILPGDELYVPGGMNMMPVSRADLNANGESNNSTAPFIEQSQTYGSLASTTFYLKEYGVNGEPTGDLVHGVDGMGTWTDIKENANKWARAQPGADPATEMLTDLDIFDIPDPAFWVPTANGGLGAFNSGAGTGQAFLADIAHNAVPVDHNGVPLTADADTIINPHGFNNPPPATGEYDNELLEAHYISGDPRANENSALTAIHTAFHGEHSRILGELENLILQQDQVQPGYAAQWTGEMKFQAVKIANEMQYQHLVFEEFGRRMSPNIDAFANYQVDINPNITAEFSQAVYRLGHSQLTDNVKSINATGSEVNTTLIEAFLNPEHFAEHGAGDLLKGAQFEQGGRIDEFVVDGLRNFLVGLSLDLAAINIARGRELQLPSLNQLRADLFAQTGDSTLQAYVSWNDFGANLLNPASLVNFIAAYSHDAAVVAARATGDNAAARLAAEAVMADATLMGSGAGRDMGLEDIDLWMGGLAEKKVPLGLLGSTFDFVFAQQMLALQNGDRFYYLARLGGNLLDQIEGQTLADLMTRSADAMHLGGDAFGTPDVLIELGAMGLINFTKSPSQLTEYLHEIIAGTHAANTIYAGSGNDAVYGEGGDDLIFAGENDDRVFGGAGNDVIWADLGFDVIRGDDGDDEIHGGADDDVLFGNRGNDVLFGDNGFDELISGEGDDIAYGGNQDDGFLGGEGNDTLYGGNGSDDLNGEVGDDVLFGGADADILFGDVGDDMMYGGSGGDAFDGGVGGYDIVNYDDYLASQTSGTVPGLTINMINPAASTGQARDDTFLDIEAIIGTKHNDIIIGDDLAGRVYDGGFGNDLLTGGILDDTLIGNGGNDNIVGGLGVDTALFLGDRANFTISAAVNGYNVTDNVGNQGTDFVSNDVEWLSFDNGLYNPVTQQYAPLVNLRNSAERVQNGTTVIGELEATVQVLDNTSLAGLGKDLGAIDVLYPLPANAGNGGLLTVAIDPASPDAGAFTIRNVGGERHLFLTGGGTLSKVNFEAKKVYNVSLTAGDAIGGSAINVTVKVEDVNDNAPVVSSIERVNVDEGISTSHIFYYASADDLDTTGEAITYSLGGPDAAAFNFVNGQLTFVNSPLVGAPTDVGADNIYNVSITASDGVNTSAVAKNVAIHVKAPGAGPTVNTITGDEFANTLLGTSGVDEIFGLAGDDILIGQEDNDFLYGGAGVDTLDGRAGADYMDGGTENDKYFVDGFDTVVDSGSSLNDRVQILSQTGDTLDLTGWSGIERYSGNIGNDVIDGSSVAEELVILGGNGMDTLSGGSQNDTILGGNDNDIINGNGGDDRIQGGAGDDTAFGGAGDDIFWVTDLGDEVHGGTNGVIGDRAHVIGTGPYTIGTWTGLEAVYGTGTVDDNIDATGMATGITLYGRGGNDTLIGSDNADTFYGANDNDTISGAGGNDILIGGNGADTLNGGADNDYLRGDLNGGSSSADVFIFNDNWGADTIGDFEDGVDTINFVGTTTATSLLDLTIVSDGLGNTTITETATPTNTILLFGVADPLTIDGNDIFFI